MTEQSYIPIGSITKVIAPTLNKEYRKSSSSLIAFRKFAESRTIEIVESISSLTKLSKRKTLTQADVLAYFQVTNFKRTGETNYIPYINIVRLANKVLGSDYRKTKPSILLIREKIEFELRELTAKIIVNMSTGTLKTITEKDVIMAMK